MKSGLGQNMGSVVIIMPSRDFRVAKPWIASGKFTIKWGQSAILPRNFRPREIFRKKVPVPGLWFDLDSLLQEGTPYDQHGASVFIAFHFDDDRELAQALSS
jgi:hypothetical protein